MCMHASMCTYMNLTEYVQMSADMHISSKTDEDDRCECILAWVCVGGGWGNLCLHDGKMLSRHGSTMTALWVSSFSPSLPSSLLPPSFLKAQTLPVVTLEYCRPGWSTPLLGRRMSAQAWGSFDKQSIYWYMIKYARNHPTAEGYYSFNIIIWINKHSVEK